MTLVADVLDSPATGPLAVRLLGPLTIAVDGRPVELTTGRLRTVVAALAISAGQAVSVERLANAVWDGRQPSHIRRTVQLYVSRLRQVLGAQRIDGHGIGYVLRTDPDNIDVLRFIRLVDAAAAARDTSTEQAYLADALDTWRGTPFDGVQSVWLERFEVPRLVEKYLAAVERRVDLEIAANNSSDMIGLLYELLASHPFRESLWLRLLTGLHRCGRPAEALEQYEIMRRRFARELGTDPGPELRLLHLDLLSGNPPRGAGEPAVQVRHPPPTPRQLPADIEGFTGRAEEIAWLTGTIDHADRRVSTLVTSVHGTGGVGKSALAVHIAHRFADRFPDGQLYVDLRGATDGLQPLRAHEALGLMLRALGTEPAAVPTNIDEASALFRSMVAGRRLLIVLDNAADSAQVEPLLPASPGCWLLVTSRKLLSSLPGVRHLHLNVLSAEDAAALLAYMAGTQRTTTAPSAVAEVVQLCEFLPLALRIAGARLAARPTWSVDALAERLRIAHRRLDELELGKVAVRASLAVSHQQLSESDDEMDRLAARSFGLLGVLDSPEFDVFVAARLLDVTADAAEPRLERLVDAHLLESPSSGRYRMHDLLRLFARELPTEQRPGSEPAAALTRAIQFYAATAWGTLELLRPSDIRLQRMDRLRLHSGLRFSDTQSALAWLEAERENLMTSIAQAESHPGVPSQLAIQLTHALFGFFVVHSHWNDWIAANHTALKAATDLGDRVAAAQACNDLGVGYWRKGRYTKAASYLQQSLEITRELEDGRGLALGLLNLGVLYQRQELFDLALTCQHESLAISLALGDQRNQAINLNNMGEIYERQGHYDLARSCHTASLEICRRHRDQHGQADSLGNLGLVHQRQGRYWLALAHLQESLAIRHALDDRAGLADGLTQLGMIFQHRGHHRSAITCYRHSLAVRQELGDPFGRAETLRELGAALFSLGRVEEAHSQWRHALALFERLPSEAAGEIQRLLTQTQEPEALSR